MDFLKGLCQNYIHASSNIDYYEEFIPRNQAQIKDWIAYIEKCEENITNNNDVDYWQVALTDAEESLRQCGRQKEILADGLAKTKEHHTNALKAFQRYFGDKC